MAKVPLRAYNAEIEKLVDRGVTDEAIAHCRHILRTFPKHLETYRLLGKAYLEVKQYAQATDIFQRVLMSVPDDFLAHVGMSIIADDQKRLDDSIWHMERAFETQPANAAIQGELQKLYGRRDGMEPPKIRLTRGALAHMYLQGDLYSQAIAEILSVLAEDFNRTDMLDLLALAYFRNGQKTDASDACAKLIASNPYCLNANRILVEILPSTGLVESTQVYRQHVVELDPYAAFVTTSLFMADSIAENAVTLDKLDYKGQQVEMQPGWSTSAGVPASSNPATQPEWLKNVAAEQISPTAAVTNLFDSLRAAPAAAAAAMPESSAQVNASPEPIASASGEAIPDWMRAVGWGENTGVFDEAAASTTEEPAAAPELEKADLPDWIKSMAPTAPEPAAPSPASKQDDTMDWLSRLGGEQPSMPAPAQAATPPASSSRMDWLNDFSATPAQPAAAEPESLDWLNNLGGGEPAAAGAPAANVPDWLSSMSAQETEKPSEPEPAWQPINILQEEPASLAPSTPEGVEQAKSLAESAPSKETSPSTPLSSIGDLGTSAAEQDAAMLWLESLAAKGGANADELITDPNARTKDAPEWVEQAKSVGESVAPAMPAAMDEDTGAFNFGDSQTDLMGSWLRDLDAKDAQGAESLSMAAAPLEAESAAWSAPTETPAASTPMAEPNLEEDLPPWLRDMQSKDAAAGSVSPNEDLPGWLKGEADAVDAVPEPTRPADWSPVVPPESSMRAPATAKPAPRTSSRASDAKAEPKKPVPPAPAAELEMGRVRRTGMLPPLIDPVLAQARDQLAHAKVPDALQTYIGLIRKGRLLEEVTFDLKDALYRFPVEVSIWQALGDAYMRANRLQDALDAYTKAEELLR